MRKVLGLVMVIGCYLILEWLLNHEILLIASCISIFTILYIKYRGQVNSKLKGIFILLTNFLRTILRFINLIYTLIFIYININKSSLGIPFLEAIKTASIIGNKLSIKHGHIEIKFQYKNKFNRSINRLNRKISLKILKSLRFINNSISSIKPLLQQI